MTQKDKTGKIILLYFTGWLSAFFALAGFLLPVIPGTAFFVISITCFARCSPSFQTYVRKSAYLTKLMGDYEAGHGFPKKMVVTCFIFCNISNIVALTIFPEYWFQLFSLAVLINAGLYLVFYTKI